MRRTSLCIVRLGHTAGRPAQCEPMTAVGPDSSTMHVKRRVATFACPMRRGYTSAQLSERSVEASPGGNWKTVAAMTFGQSCASG